MTTPQATVGTIPSTAKQADAILQLTNVHHRWRSNRPPILLGVDLKLFPGTVTWIGGRNGVGKTTLLRIAAGILIPQMGEVRLLGLHPISDRGAFQRRLGYLSAGDRGLYARMSVRQHLDYWARLAYVPRRDRSRHVDEGLAAFGLEPMASQRVDRMSMGQRQRVRLAMAFLHRPEVILLDEPRNSLDEDGYQLLNEQIEAAASRGAAVLWCSPRGEEKVLDLDASYALEDGHLVAAE